MPARVHANAAFRQHLFQMRRTVSDAALCRFCGVLA